EGHVLETALNEHYFVDVLAVPGNRTRKQMAVYYYCDALKSIEYSNNPSTTLEVDGNKFLTVEFIHANILACCTGLVVSSDGGSTNMLHSLKLLYTLPFKHEVRSDIHWSADASKMVFALDGDLKGCLLPHDGTTLVILGLTPLSPPRDWSGEIGVSASLFLATHGPSEIVTYYWDSISGARPNRTLSVDIPEPTFLTMLFSFDEDIGRLVLFEDACSVELTIVDLV
ncbi:hypothetical protein P691DRAFT_786887, partial [Macrolepiota fuliginosa MF-IS2]